ncbi:MULTISPECIES: MarR family winged helix-turn-helix transcriptional regulator [Paracoccus]|jgi:DNA-binding MarR family transcriptional regulator|uniref:MarR family transcriptional regulator n=1 Tax=Paracoccus litorisediminis TaxID=2006130 RepID=A0A844HWY1_9RHOB|nr:MULTISPECIES: MarR family transcriptional regulator [Paracoccus]MBD9529207.1 MarR family transcriptional regulator [Paracoccus sp. PAR01]MTH61972.1 MarR family transcriptional regulator [Paracoccus litorisediminis]
MPGKPVEHQPSGTEGSADALAASLFSEVFIADQLARDLIGKSLPKGMQISHFSVLNLLAHLGVERSPAELAEAFHVTRGAMTNTLSRLEWAGHIHIRPDWDDARRKFVAISPAGRAARDAALAAFMPRIGDVVREIGAERVRAALPVLRLLRRQLEEALRPEER